MSAFRFPFNWGSVPDSVSVTTVTSVSTALWATLANTSKAWTEGTSQPHRFERIYTQPKGVFGQSINFAFKVSSQFPFIVKSQFPILVTSTITNP